MENKETEMVDKDVMEDDPTMETQEEDTSASESPTPVRNDAEIDELEQDLKHLDNLELGLFNKEKMERLLNYLLEQDSYEGEFNPTVAAEIADEIIDRMTSVEDLPENAVVAPNHTASELDELSRRLWRIILASQYKRRTMSRRELKEAGYIVLEDQRVVITTEENHLLSYLSSSMALLDHSPKRESMKSGQWTNTLTYNDKRIGAAVVGKHRDPVKQVMSKLNLLSESVIPLPHSGMVLKLASPGSLDRALLNDNLTASKIEHALLTHSHGMDITSIYTNEILVEYAYRQIVDSNVGNLSRETFEDNLTILDLDVLYQGLAIATYPTGFDLHRQCINRECQNVDKMKINPRRSIIFRKDRLSDRQQQMLTRGFTKADVSNLVDYRESLNPDVSKFYDLGDDIYIKLQIPSFSEYRRISNTWLTYLGDKSMELMSGSQDENARQRYISQALAKSGVMMYAHWVEGIYSRDDNGDYTPVLTRIAKAKGVTSQAISVADDNIGEFLSNLIINTEAHNKLLEGIQKFIRESALVVIALPKTPCTKCGSPHTPEGEETADELITYNVGELFFTLLHQGIAER